MLLYWLLFMLFAIGSILSMRQAAFPAYAYEHAGPPLPAGNPAETVRNRQKALFFASLVPIILIGFRYRVGTDYPTYAEMFRRISRLSLNNSFNQVDVGYAALNWFIAQAGGGFWIVNLVCGVLFTYGLVQFAKTQPNPWLAITIAIPYLVITVGMGYSRQAVAIGMAMSGLAAVSRGSFAKFIAYVLVGALFHRSVLILLPIVTLAYSRNRLVAVGAGIFGSLLGYWVLTSGRGYERLQENYISHVLFESQGAGIRLAMNIPPAVLFLLFMRRFSPDKHERLTYAILSAIAFISLILLYLFPRSSTPLDRMALYVIPLQLFVLSRLPSVLPDERGHPSGPLTIAIIIYSAIVEFVWLNYATFAQDWIPYQFYPFHLFA
jgi:hypothetical protein